MANITTTVVQNDRGSEDVLIEAGGRDGVQLARDLDAALKDALTTQMRNARFSGRFQIVILAKTPVTERRLIVPVVERTRKLCAELMTAEGPYQVVLTYEDKASLDRAPVAVLDVPADLDARIPPVDPAPRSRLPLWIGAGVVAAAVAGVAAFMLLKKPLPGTLEFGKAPLLQASRWDREAVSGGVYVQPGEPAATASLRVDAMISKTLRPARQLAAWPRTDFQRGAPAAKHEVAFGDTSCRIDSASGGPSFVRLVTCKNDDDHSVCVRASETIGDDAIAACDASPSDPEKTACFNDICTRRRQARSAILDDMAAALLAR